MFGMIQLAMLLLGKLMLDIRMPVFLILSTIMLTFLLVIPLLSKPNFGTIMLGILMPNMIILNLLIPNN
jgi:hypothetical protein